jgi:hypothetical protein
VAGLKTGEARARVGYWVPPGRRHRHAAATRRGSLDTVGRVRARGRKTACAAWAWATEAELGRRKERGRGEESWAGFG